MLVKLGYTQPPLHFHWLALNRSELDPWVSWNSVPDPFAGWTRHNLATLDTNPKRRARDMWNICTVVSIRQAQFQFSLDLPMVGKYEISNDEANITIN